MSIICNCLVLYDMNPEKCDLKGWLVFMEEWAAEKHIEWGSISMPGPRKLIQFKNGKRKLEKNGFDSLDYLGIYGGVDELGTSLNWKVTGYFDPSNKLFYLCFWENIAGFNKDVIQGFFGKLLSFCDARYGIAYQGDYMKGPEWYPFGVISSSGRIEIAKEERSRISKWNNAYNYSDGDYHTGLLRDIYPYNILVDAHLDQDVDGTTLGEWIRQNPARGKLEKITDAHWIWSLSPEQIPAVQEALDPTGLLLCYRPD